MVSLDILIIIVNTIFEYQSIKRKEFSHESVYIAWNLKLPHINNDNISNCNVKEMFLWERIEYRLCCATTASCGQCWAAQCSISGSPH